MVIQHFWSAEVKAEVFTLFTQEGKKKNKKKKEKCSGKFKWTIDDYDDDNGNHLSIWIDNGGNEKMKGKLKKAKTGRLAILRTMKTKGYQNVISPSQLQGENNKRANNVLVKIKRKKKEEEETDQIK